MKLTSKQLLKELRNLMERPHVRLRQRKMLREHGKSSWTPDRTNSDVKDVLITVDPRNAPVVSVVVHELLHVYMAMLFELDSYFAEELEEAIILGMDRKLESYLNHPRNERALESWAKAIDKKLNSEAIRT